jgi:hypothetical protein
VQRERERERERESERARERERERERRGGRRGGREGERPAFAVHEKHAGGAGSCRRVVGRGEGRGARTRARALPARET